MCVQYPGFHAGGGNFAKSMPMHILQLGPYPPPEGGISRNMLAIRDELRVGGHRCSIAATSRSSRVGAEPDVYHPGSALALIRLLASLKFDVLHLHIGGDIGTRVLLLAFAATVFGRGQCILTLHSGQFPLTNEAKNAGPQSIRGRIFRRFVRIIAVSNPIADVFRRYGVPDERIEVIVPFSAKLPDPEVEVPAILDDFRRKHSPMLLAVGGLEKDYDPLFQITAMKDIVAEFPSAGLMIVGDGSMRAEVEQAVSASGHAGAIMIAGNIDHAVTLHLIDASDLLLRTTLFDGDAISVREALFLGTPVIATDNGMRPERVHVIAIGDRRALIENVSEAVKGGKHERAISPPDDKNIEKIIKVYKEIAPPSLS